MIHLYYANIRYLHRKWVFFMYLFVEQLDCKYLQQYYDFELSSTFVKKNVTKRFSLT